MSKSPYLRTYFWRDAENKKFFSERMHMPVDPEKELEIEGRYGAISTAIYIEGEKLKRTHKVSDAKGVKSELKQKLKSQQSELINECVFDLFVKGLHQKGFLIATENTVSNYIAGEFMKDGGNGASLGMEASYRIKQSGESLLVTEIVKVNSLTPFNQWAQPNKSQMKAPAGGIATFMTTYEISPTKDQQGKDTATIRVVDCFMQAHDKEVAKYFGDPRTLFQRIKDYIENKILNTRAKKFAPSGGR